MERQPCTPPLKFSAWNATIGGLDTARHDAAAIANGALDKLDYVENWVDQIEWEHSLAETLYAIQENAQNPTEDQGAAEVVVVALLIVAF
jgi:hypothetical protein